MFCHRPSIFEPVSKACCKRRAIRQQGGIQRQGWGERGLTFAELAVVVAVLAILASITMIAVGGSGPKARGVAKSTDIREVQKAVNIYHGMHPQEQWPTFGKQVGAVTIPIGKAPTAPFQPSDPATFVAIDWDATFTTTLDGAKALVPSYLPRTPKHALDTTSDADGDSVDEQPAPTRVWVLDNAGIVHVLLKDIAY